MIPQTHDARPAPRQKSGVLVVGSANIDISVTVDRHPVPGETRPGTGSLISVGGKGANQAAAAALAGAPTRFVGNVGDDAFGAMVLKELAARGVALEHCRIRQGATTGLATITVDSAGQNAIVVVPGANALLAPADIRAIEEQIRSAAVMVLQCEVPQETIREAISLAASCGTPVVFNPAPAGGLDLASLVPGVSCFVPNESEAATLTGLPVNTVDDAIRCAGSLVVRGFPCVIITLGAAGCVCADAAGATHLPAPVVDAVDTTGAGDAFIGCFAAALAAGIERDTAIQRALRYASLATTRRGALVSYPSARETEISGLHPPR